MEALTTGVVVGVRRPTHARNYPVQLEQRDVFRRGVLHATVGVNGISPGPFETDMNAAVLKNPEVNAQFIASLPIGRWGKVEEIGSLACYLCSEAAGYITGTDIIIDGGWTAK